MTRKHERIPQLKKELVGVAALRMPAHWDIVVVQKGAENKEIGHMNDLKDDHMCSGLQTAVMAVAHVAAACMKLSTAAGVIRQILEEVEVQRTDFEMVPRRCRRDVSDTVGVATTMAERDMAPTDFDSDRICAFRPKNTEWEDRMPGEGVRGEVVVKQSGSKSATKFRLTYGLRWTCRVRLICMILTLAGLFVIMAQ